MRLSTTQATLPFDIGGDVRLVAFSRASDDYLDPESLRDVRISQEEFYGILQRWHEGFATQWASLAKSRGSVWLVARDPIVGV